MAGRTHPEQLGTSRGNPESLEIRGTGRGTIFVAVGRIRKSRNKSEKSGDERNRKGNNFVAVGRIRDKSEKVGKSGRSRKNPEMSGTGRGTIL